MECGVGFDICILIDGGIYLWRLGVWGVLCLGLGRIGLRGADIQVVV